MAARGDTRDYRQIFLQQLPIMDTRAPVEFSHGAFPNATNLPLMTDDERHEVGICYKANGQAAAIELGHSLVTGDVRERRLAQWCEFASRNSQGYLYCFRGGLRSRTTQQWMRDAGVDYPLVEGGYKAMRRFLLDELDASVARASLLLVAGKTGTGKTRVIEALERAIDLEGLARHRGSTFGQLLEEQPSQIDFENAVSIDLMRMLNGNEAPVILEDEGRLIGRVCLPETLRLAMVEAPMLIVDEPIENRVDNVIADYVDDLGTSYREAFGIEQGATAHRDKLLADLGRIRKRLGGKRHAEVDAHMRDAFGLQHQTGDISAHRVWIRELLLDYYDPMYDYQLDKRQGVVLGSGNREEVTQQARDYRAANREH